MPLSNLSTTIAKSKHPLMNTMLLFVLVAFLFMPELAFAQDTRDKVCTFFGSIKGILNAASIVVVTVAVIFSGYQIAFAHKRISDVTPALIGGVLIGAAAQIAKTVVGDGDGGGSSTQCQDTGTVGLIYDSIQMAMHFLHLHA